MKEKFFLKVGYTPFLESKKEKWTKNALKKILEHKFLATAIAIVVMCMATNTFLIYRFISIMENLHKI